MTLVLPTLAVAIAAFCIWLAVRIFNRRERWAKWTLASALSLPLLYVASFGPACWITSRANFGGPAVGVFYRPIAPVMWWTGNGSVFGQILVKYSRLAAAPDWTWMKVDLFGPDPPDTGYIWVHFKN